MPPLPGDVQWFPAEIRRLICAIKKHDGLYNPRTEYFGLRDYQTRTWKSVAEEVGGGKTDTQCRDKWNCLRGTYRRHVRTEATNTVKRRSGWPWADMMVFIKPFVSEAGDIPPAADTNKSTTPPTSKPAVNQTVVLTKPTVNMVRPGLTLAHKSNCPMTVKAGGTLTLASNMFPGGFIFNNGIRVVQPNQGNMIGVVQPNQLNLVQSPQGVMKFVQANTGVGIVQPTQKSIEKEKPAKTKSSFESDVDLKRVKHDPDNEPKTTEFVDMEVAIKTEPLEEEELQLPDTYSYLPEDSQENSQDASRDNSQDAISSRESNGRSPDKNLPESQEDIDSNELFMKSTICHMRKLSAYDQSVFKLKVQQLLHDMMFPKP
ncbi:uncharacterized protein LOC128992549 [Macrosteles quadrilineatus]|uniref:uncharacterized protein LOC128992549 n=1 Tax=Macrosteles quadrilineatus TaxID=74068 RepID=UPI0023E34097|nr:uncharacterized protein LOC128992549 [Macrosteles quadrilineatus]